jgi:hypothetical protein
VIPHAPVAVALGPLKMQFSTGERVSFLCRDKFESLEKGRCRVTPPPPFIEQRMPLPFFRFDSPGTRIASNHFEPLKIIDGEAVSRRRVMGAEQNHPAGTREGREESLPLDGPVEIKEDENEGDAADH